jgi:DNA polymerase
MAYPEGMTSWDESLSALAWLIDAGADEAVLEAPVDRLTAKPAAAPAAAPGEKVRRPAVQTPARPAIPMPAAPVTYPRTAMPTPGDEIGNAQIAAGNATSLAELKAALEAFDGCALKKIATNTVFADGTPSHRIMLIGEAPGRDEDRAGLPFVGRAGQLLDKMLAPIGLSRKENVYITNVLNWRPPDNRDPSPEEAALCLPFLRRHIELVDPGIIVLLGATAARHVMGRTDGIMRLRGKWLEYHVNGRMVPVMPTLHPAYLLRRAIDKKLAWRDLQQIESKIRELNLLEAPAVRD